jgi:hypothetical protein
MNPHSNLQDDTISTFGKTPLGNTGSNRQKVPSFDTKTQTLIESSPFAVQAKGAEPEGSVATISRNSFLDGRLVPRLHWLQGTVKITDEELFIYLIEQLLIIFDDEGIFDGGVRGGRVKKYLKSGYSTKNIIYSWNPPQTLPTGEQVPGDGWISISGAVLDSVSLSSLKDACLLLCSFEFKATRLDFAIDDFSCPSIESFISQAIAGNYAGFRHKPVGSGKGAREPSYHVNSSPYTEDDITRQAYTLNFGGKGSDKKFKIYDKWAESRGLIKATRFEAQFEDEQANVRFDALCGSHLQKSLETTQKLIGSFCLGAIDFLDRTEDERKDRCTRFPWWQELIDAIDSIKLPVIRPIPSLERTLEWCERQWSCTAASLEKICGFNDALDYFTRLFDNGKKRLKSPHLSIINQAIKEGFNINQYLQSAY